MKKNRTAILGIMAVVLLLNVAIMAYVLPSGGEEKPTEPVASQSQPVVQDPVELEPVPSEADVIEWNGWQEATPAVEPLELFADQQLTQPLELNAECGGDLIICQRINQLCKVRYGSATGWTTLDKLVIPESEPYIYQTDENTLEPANLADTEIGQRLDSVAKKHNCVGVQAAIIKDGRITHLYEYGYQDRGKKIPVTSDTKIRVASVSKVIVGMGVLSMHDLGILDIDEDINSYWSEPVRNPNHPESPITLRNILTHTSSFKDFGYKKRALSALEKNMQKSGSFMSTMPGDIASYKYNNSALCSAGAIAGRAGNCNFDQYIREYFFQPMGIDASFHAKNIVDQDSISVIYNDGTVTLRVNDFLDMTFYGGVGEDYSYYAGSLVISAKDLAKMTCVLLGEGSYEQMYYLKPETVSKMLERQYQLKDYDQCLVLRYKEDLIGENDLYYHNGNMAGVYSLMCFDPVTGNGMVVISNGSKEPKMVNGVYSVCADLAAIAAELWS